ncbi:MAG: hypothetical protein UZ14_CFX002001551 [Chloroflexi bacterium OLB14]|nr:MAG: hypothetical protein UZ14_CFX002001551 [Chloroflexi bacterium OLB14]
MKNLKVLAIIIFFLLLASDFANAFPALEDEQIAFGNWFSTQSSGTQVMVVIGTIGIFIWLAVIMKSKKEKFSLATTFAAIFYSITLGYALILDRLIDRDAFVWNAFFGFGLFGTFLGFAVITLIGFYWGDELGLYEDKN